MKFFESRHEFEYSWEEVSTANWRKYCPWNDKSTHVIAVDTLARSVDPVTGIVRLPFLRNIHHHSKANPFPTVTNRAPYNLQAIRSEMAKLVPRRPRNLPRLRDVLRGPQGQESHHVQHKHDLGGPALGARDRHLQALVHVAEFLHAVRPVGPDRRAMRRLAEDQELDRGDHRRALQAERHSRTGGLRGRAGDEQEGVCVGEGAPAYGSCLNEAGHHHHHHLVPSQLRDAASEPIPHADFYCCCFELCYLYCVSASGVISGASPQMSRGRLSFVSKAQLKSSLPSFDF